MTVWLADGTKATVEDVSSETLDEAIAVYNFEVEDFHTYFVGHSGVWVHNACDGTYRDQGGHHPMAKSAFSGDPLYDPNDALTVSNDLLQQYDVTHQNITGVQHTLYSAFAKTGQPLTFEVMQGIESQAMIQSGMPADIAWEAVQEATEQLIGWGITGPSSIPWN